MRLINTHTLDLSDFFGSDIPKYAVLSHTWEKNGEITYQEWIARDKTSITHKSGYQKIIGACQKAYKRGIDWLWADTNCIDKTSSAELSEAINSMFTWYRNSVECFVYLADVDIKPDDDDVGGNPLFRQSRWFTRGWTLQELLAPMRVIFYSCDWRRLGRRDGSLLQAISEVTGIGMGALRSTKIMSEASIAAKMSWLSRRETTRVEDLAYCMLGIFDLNMPLLYGEGPKAFARLQEEIIKTSNDHSIFAWSWDDDVPPDWTSILAPAPSTFRWAADLFPSRDTRVNSYSITNSGLSIKLAVRHSMGADWILLDVADHRASSFFTDYYACIPITGYHGYGEKVCTRLREPRKPILLPGVPAFFTDDNTKSDRIHVFLKSRSIRFDNSIETGSMRKSNTAAASRFAVLLFLPPVIAEESAKNWANWVSTTPPNVMDGSGIFRFGGCNNEADLSSVVISFRNKLIYVAVSCPERRQSAPNADYIWYMKTWSLKSGRVPPAAEHLQRLDQAVRNIEARSEDPETVRDRNGVHIGVGGAIVLEDAIESRVISLDEDLQPILSLDKPFDYLGPSPDDILVLGHAGPLPERVASSAGRVVT